MMKTVFTVSQLFIYKTSTATFSDEAAEESLNCCLLTGEADVETTEAVHKIVGFSSAATSFIRRPTATRSTALSWPNFTPATANRPQPLKYASSFCLLNATKTDPLSRLNSQRASNRARWFLSTAAAAAESRNESIRDSIEDARRDLLAFILGLPGFVLNSHEYKSLKFSENPYDAVREFLRNFHQGSAKSKLLTYPNGDSYWGRIEGGKRNGFGRHQHKDGSLYEGLYLEDERNGFGVYTHHNGEIYCGDHLNNQREGLGYYRWTHGSQHFGFYSHGQRHGLGVQGNLDGSFFVGEFQQGKYGGKGSYLWPADAGHPDGPFSKKYSGYFSNDLINGQGKMWYRDGSFYEGGFMEGNEHGEGYLTLPGGQPVKVEFEHGKRISAASVALKRFRRRLGSFYSNPVHVTSQSFSL